MAGKAGSLLVGKCMPSVKAEVAKICVTRMELDPNLLMYFKNLTVLYAHDPEKKCKSGDIVLVEELKEKMSKLVTHKVNEVVFPLGDVVDPITGKRVTRTSFRENVKEASQLFGEVPSAFDYEKAPPRGWQEGKKDFTDKDTYVKYHENGKDQPYGV